MHLLYKGTWNKIVEIYNAETWWNSKLVLCDCMSFTSESKSWLEMTKTCLYEAEPAIMCPLQLRYNDLFVRRNSLDASWEHWKSVPTWQGSGWHHHSIISSMCWGHKVKGTGWESVDSIVLRISNLLVSGDLLILRKHILIVKHLIVF